MKKLILLLFLIIAYQFSFSQNKVKGNLTNADTADLTILSIYPDTFPRISVFFKAETRLGLPFWNLTKEKMKVAENGQSCKVISLKKLSQNNAINLGIIVDHSGSMAEDPTQLYDEKGNPLFSFNYNGEAVFPNDYIEPIEKAKTAVKNFVTSFNTKKDFISIIGFSNKVDKPLPLTHSTDQINNILDSMHAGNSTAFYDALMEGIDQMESAKGIKVLVALTDGIDNASKFDWQYVTERAKDKNIPIYIVGLGNVNTDTLSLICKETNGKFFYTKSSKSLEEVYATISGQIQAFYDLVYETENFSSDDSHRDIELSFDVDSVYLITHSKQAFFPPEIVEVIESKERQKSILIYGGIGIVTLIAAGTILYTFRRKKKSENELKLITVYPNPTSGNISLEFSGLPKELTISSISGKKEKVFTITSDEKTFDLSDLSNGVYLVSLTDSSKNSNTLKVILQK